MAMGNPFLRPRLLVSNARLYTTIVREKSEKFFPKSENEEKYFSSAAMQSNEHPGCSTNSAGEAAVNSKSEAHNSKV